MITRRALLTASTAALAVARARAQSYPARPIRLVVPYTPGSPNDVLARLFAPALGGKLGEALVLDNRPGGGTIIGAKAVLAAEPDGHTLLFTNTPTHPIAPLISRNAGYDPINDFAPVAMVGITFLVMVVAPSVAANSVEELVRHAKANPGALNFGFGQGTFPQLAGELFQLETGTRFANIPYKGGAQAVTDILGGRLQVNFGTIATLLPLIRAGKLKALAVTGESRAGELPEVPTMIESGWRKVTTATYYGLIAPARTPAAIVELLNRESNACLDSPELRASITKLGFAPASGSPRDFAARIAQHLEKWAPIVEAVAFEPN